ncbi:hypothetical protein EDD85DRAFT_943469 [Armillaria nabsnona]|nr:hypothetical protein EDD85DRAFT_943469 [Armillaria nabsnona]
MPLHLRGLQNASEAEKAMPGGGFQTTFQVEGFIQESGSNGNLAKKKTTKKAAQKTTQPKGHSRKEKPSNTVTDHSTPPMPTSRDSVRGVVMQELEEDDEESPFVALLLPPSSLHALEGPGDSSSPFSTPTRTTPANAVSYQFVHFDLPRTSSFADGSFPSVPGSLTSDVQNLMLSNSSDSSSSSLSAKDSSQNTDNVWSFYIKEGDHHMCKLCWGDKHKKNGKDKVYSIKTGMTGLQYHLIKDHLWLWVSACDKMGVLVKGVGIRAAERFWCENSIAKFKEGPLSVDFTIPNYSHEAFVDAIVKWIIADDQSIKALMWVAPHNPLSILSTTSSTCALCIQFFRIAFASDSVLASLTSRNVHSDGTFSAFAP